MTFDMKNRTTLYKFYSRRPAERVVHKLSYEEGTRWNHNQAQWGFYPSHATLNGFQHNAMDAILSGAWDNHSVDCVGFDATEGQQVFRVNLPSPEHSRIILWMGRQVLRFYTVFPAVGGLLTGGRPIVWERVGNRYTASIYAYVLFITLRRMLLFTLAMAPLLILAPISLVLIVFAAIGELSSKLMEWGWERVEKFSIRMHGRTVASSNKWMTRNPYTAVSVIISTKKIGEDEIRESREYWETSHQD